MEKAMHNDMLPHLFEIKTMLAQQGTEIKNLTQAVSGHDGEGGMQARVSSLEHDRIRFKAAATAIGFVAGTVGGFIGWVFSFIKVH